MRTLSLLLLATFIGTPALGQDYQYELSMPSDWGNRVADHIYQEEDGTLWTSVDDSLFRVRDGRLVNLGSELNVTFGSITGIGGTSEGKICLSTNGNGLFIFNGNELSQIHEGNGLRSNNCNVLFVDALDYIWIGTDNGLSKIRLGEEDELEISTFTELNGLPHARVTDVVKVGADLWVTTERGSVRFEEKKEAAGRTPVGISITNISFDQRDTTVQPSYKVSHNTHRIRIDFEATNNIYREQVTFKYKILGMDTSFTYTSQPWVELRSLPAGQYNFLVSARTSSGFWSPEPASVKLNVPEPFTQTWWFQALPANLILVLFLVLYFFRLRQIRLREKQKTEFNKKLSEVELKALRSQMDPHFIFNSLNSVSHFITGNDPEQANKYLSKFAKLMRMILESSKSLTIPIEDELELIRFYMELEALRFDEPFTFNITVDDTIDAHNEEIPTMLIQPYVENAIWHGLTHKEGPGHIDISLTAKEDSLRVTIQDNGVGREATKKIGTTKSSHKSMGMDVTRERLEILNALGAGETNINITDMTDDEGNATGTQVRIYIPIT